MFNKTKHSFFLVILFFFCIECIHAHIRISAIVVEGNKQTKEYIILRELPYHVGDFVSKDSLSYLNMIAQQQLVNTSLFTDVLVTSIHNDSMTCNIKIQVNERKYFFPIPVFKLVDRNFSQWWNVAHRSLDRVNYGINIRGSNFTGNYDKFTLGLIAGYTQQAIIRYQFPYLDKKLKFGAGLGLQYFAQKEINTSSVSNKQVFYRTEGVIQKGYRSNISCSYRPNLYARHILQIGIGKNEISDSAFLIQPAYLPSFGKSFSYLDFTLSFSKIKFDYNPYPTNGSSTEFLAFHRFSNKSNLSSIQFRRILASPLSAKNFIFFESNTAIKFLPNHNYLDSKLMGYGNLQLDGLDNYVIDGNAGTLLRAEWHHWLGSLTVKNIVAKKFLPEVKYRFWLKAFTNLGYVYAEKPINNNKLSNTLLRTIGLGLDVISIYDFVLKIDYSLNQLGDKGLYLHAGLNF